ncbi:sensor histidine kinase [Segetibacter sp. 3557_3]|uniref:sensor histidine kinase n=1 Tax=Segetibacter sp. 3557_3 TaxID=2547429 RepID=UPI0014054128|nr:PAS domain-containing sensor histidine kinase [Segetibacter sp. 3557_3]
MSEDLDYAPCGFLEIDASGTITAINATFLDLLSYSEKNEIIGQHIEKLFTIASRIFYQTHFFPLVQLHGNAQEIFFTLKAKSGERLEVICNAVSKTRADTKIIQCIFIPITERGKYERELLSARRRAEEALEKNIELNQAKKELELNSLVLDRKISQLKQVNADITQFSKSISHDIQEPIRKIAVLADRIVVEVAGSLPAARIEDLEKINRECKNLRQLIIFLDRFISLNNVAEEMSLFSLSEAILSAFHQAAGQAGEVHVAFNAEELPIIEGYKSQIALLFMNIIDNSIKFRSEDRLLSIHITGDVVQHNTYRVLKNKYRYAEFLKITVSDNGKGFLIKNEEEIFRLQKLINDHGQALGFGLALSKKIVDNHFGNISVASTIGGGTIVTIFLPLSQQEPQ